MTRKFIDIHDCWAAIDECKNKEELERVLEDFPRWSGNWWIEENPNSKCRVCNEHFDRSLGQYDDDQADTDVPFCSDK